MEPKSHGYQFDGRTWSSTEDFAVVDKLRKTRHFSSINHQRPFLGSISYSRFSDWPFDITQVLPDNSIGTENVLITTDENGLLWLTTGSDLYRKMDYGFENIQEANGQWNTDDPDLKKSSVLDFNKRVFYYEIDKKPYILPWIVDTSLFWENIYYFVDQNDIAWFYHVDYGLVAVDHGNIQTFGKMPVFLPQTSIGGILVKEDGRVWIGSIGAIWEYDSGKWHQFVVPMNEIFKFFVEDSNGIVYGATDTGVYQFDNGQFKYDNFVVQDNKPFVVSENGEFVKDSVFHKNYTVISSYPGTFWNDPSPDHHYEAVFLGLQSDGSLIYINNHVIAKLKNQEWKSFVFDTITISSAAVDLDGKIWIYSISDGLLSLDAEIFNEYLDLQYP